MIGAPDLAESVNYTRQQLAGLLGAFGRRVANTPGFTNGDSFFRIECDPEGQCYRYGMPDSVREAMRLEGLA
jgi:hypothetical protein